MVARYDGELLHLAAHHNLPAPGVRIVEGRLLCPADRSFSIGVAGPNDSEMKATKLVGPQPYATFKAAIDRLLAAPKWSSAAEGSHGAIFWLPLWGP